MQMVFSTANQIDKVSTLLKGKNLNCSVHIEEKEGYWYLYTFKGNIPVFAMLAQWIYENQGKEWLLDSIEETTIWLEKEEAEELKEIILENYINQKQTFCMIIQSKLEEFIQFTSRISMDGFLRFTLYEFQDKIDMLIEEGIDAYCIKETYHHFLDLLQEYLYVEQSQINHLTIVKSPNGNYRYFDIMHREVGENYIENKSITEEDVNDNLLSVLMHMIPKEICLYGTKYIENKNIITTLEDIFKHQLRCYPGIPEWYQEE